MSEEEGIHEEYTVYSLEGQMLSGYEVDGPVSITYGANWEEISRDVDTTSFEAATLSSEDNPDSLLDDFVSAYFGKQRFFRMSNMIMKTLVTTSSTTMKVA